MTPYDEVLRELKKRLAMGSRRDKITAAHLAIATGTKASLVDDAHLLDRARAHAVQVERVSREYEFTRKPPLHIALERGYDDVIDEMLSGELRVLPTKMYTYPPGVDLHARDARRRTVLHAAAVGRPEHVRLMLARVGGDDGVDARDSHGDTPLHVATVKGNLETMRILLEHGADVDARNDEGRTPLHQAVLHGQFAAADALLQRGADVTAADAYYKHTALHMAVLVGRLDMVRLLLAHGARTRAIDARGNTPMHLAYDGKTWDIADAIAEADHHQ